MFTSMIARRSMVVAALIGLGIGAMSSVRVRGQNEPGTSHDVILPMSPQEETAALDELEKIKKMAADPQQQDAMKNGLARLMVMEEMSRMMSTDPQFQPAAVALMKDPNMKKIHDQAKDMATDPEQMKKMEQDIAGDPKAMHMLLYRAVELAASGDQAGAKKK